MLSSFSRVWHLHGTSVNLYRCLAGYVISSAINRLLYRITRCITFAAVKKSKLLSVIELRLNFTGLVISLVSIMNINVYMYSHKCMIALILKSKFK